MNPFKKPSFLKRRDRGRSYNAEDTPVHDAPSPAQDATEDASPRETVASISNLPHLPRQHSQSLTLVPQAIESIRSPSPSPSEAFTVAGPDPLGLKVLHTPPQEREVDIVFIHGLGGTSRGTWTKSKDLESFWPLKFLPLEPVIQDARILTFGYQAKFQPGAGKNKMSILDFAKDLLFDLRYAKDESAPELRELGMGERPIIFVVHSMGGLIVKEAYMQGQNDPKYESIIKAVSAIVFLSTPHRGTNLAETLNRILQVSFKTSPMKFIAELSAGSEKLEVLNDQFRHVAPKLEIVSFYETRPTTIFKKTQIMVLEKDSSVLGYPGEVSKPLDADHNSICKYESRLDPRYITVRNVLRSLVGTAKPRDGQETELSTQMVPFEQLLATPELPERDLHFFQERWTKGTCSWILRDATFMDWATNVESFEPRVLCLQGNAASGKSVLSSFIIQHLVQEGKICQYFFIRFEDKKKRSPSTVLRALACQLARSTPSYASQLRQRMNSGVDLKRADVRTVWKLLYKQALLDHGLHFPLYWVIDGLDEAEDAAALINVLADLQHVKIPLRIIMTSRPTHEINTALRNLGKVLRVEFAGIEGNQDDFRSYINTSMDLAGNDTYQRQVESQILQRAKGNFLWVHLAVQTISQCQTRVDVSKALDELPTGMEAFYKRMASAVPKESNSNDPTLGERILQWATFAQRPLRLSELTDALQNDGVLELERTIGHLCGGFVVVDQTGLVTLIHESAREYLTRKQDQEHGINMERRTTHDKLFARCMAMLTGSSLRSLVSRDRSPDFVEYASGAWFFHLAHGRPTTEHNLAILVNFLEGQHALLWIQIVAKRGQLKLLVAASRSLNALVLQLRRMNEGASLLHQHASALFESWAADLVKLVGKFGSALLSKPDAIFKLIPPFCPEESILYRQYGQKESRTLRVTGFSRRTWDDCLARLPLEQGAMSSTVLAVGDNIVILANKRSQGHIYVFGSTTFELKRRFTHPERVHTIQVDSKGERVVSYGWKTTRIWTLTTGNCIRTVQNPRTRPRPLSLLFIQDSKKVLACGDDRSIRVLCVEDDGSDQWVVLTSVEEETQEDTMTILNAPACAALSPDGDMVVFGYRGHPVTLWDLVTVEPVRQCYISGKHMGTEEHVQTLGEITSLAWHPFSGEVFGLQREGLLFKWDTNEDDASVTVQAGAHYLSVSTDGSLVVTGNTSGTLKVFLSDDLTLIYQLSSQDHVLDVAFSADSTLLYDIRGSYGNIWEPNALARLTESSEYSEHLSDAGSDYESLAKLSLRTEHTFPGVDAITVVAAQDPGQLYCYGTEQGVATLCVVGKGEILEVQRSPSFMSVEHICWSDDGQMLAVADLSREIVVRRISKDTGPDESWVATQMIRTRFQSGYEHISQLLFEPRSHRLLAASSAGLLAIDVDSGEERTAALSSDLTTVRWATHPTKDQYLLGFDTVSIHAFRWSSLEKVCSYKYTPPNPGSIDGGPEQDVAPDRATLQVAGVALGRVLATRGSPDAVLEIVQPALSGSHQKHYLIFTLQNLSGLEDSPATTETADPSMAGQPELLYTLIPPEVASRIREPLGLVARGKLLYLDVDKWICTWRLPSTIMRSSIPRRGSEQSITQGIERPYFLPGDWLTANEARLCVATRNGTLICPRNGDAATVQYLRPL